MRQNTKLRQIEDNFEKWILDEEDEIDEEGQ